MTKKVPYGLMRGSRGGPLGRHDMAAGRSLNLLSTLPTHIAFLAGV
jgi:hypothetical protein